MYTRWRSKDELLVAAYAHVSRPFPTLDTGSLRGDFDLLWQTVLAGAADHRYGIVMAELLGAAATKPELRPVLQAVGDNWNTGIEAMLRAGQDRGELDADVDVVLLTDAIVSLTLRRLLFGLRPIETPCGPTSTRSSSTRRRARADRGRAKGRPLPAAPRVAVSEFGSPVRRRRRR